MKRRSIILLSCLACLVMAGCATKSTKVVETSTRGFGAAPQIMGPIVLGDDTTILDARSSFDYSMARIPKSMNINWVDFSEREPKLRGWPQKDSFAATRRLARMGIGPKTKVVIFGNGPDGQGEEGRIAWYLSYLGVDHVQFARFGSIRSKLTTEAVPAMAQSAFSDENSREHQLKMRDAVEEAGPVPVPIWKPNLEGSLIVTKAELKGAIQNHAIQKPWSYKGGRVRRYRIFDVRLSSDYLGQTGGLRSRAIPDIGAINAPWKEFFDEDLRVSSETGEQIKALGVKPSDRIIVIDNDGVASAAVVMALRALGYRDAGLYAGGYNDLTDLK